MRLNELIDNFAVAIKPAVLSDWELEEFCELLLDYSDDIQEALIKQVGIIWPVSNSLCRNVLAGAKKASACIPADQIGEWVKAILGKYEEDGLKAAQETIDDIETNFLCLREGEAGLRLHEVSGRLQHYLQGISGQQFELAEGPQVSTDTERIFLPGKLNTMPTRQENFLLYKLMTTYQWGYSVCGTFRINCNEIRNSLGNTLPERLQQSIHPEDGLHYFFNKFQNPLPAIAIFHLLETTRVTHFLWKIFPGLMTDCRPLFDKLLIQLDSAASSPLESIYREIQKVVLQYKPGKEIPYWNPAFPTLVTPHMLFSKLGTALDSLCLTFRLVHEELASEFPAKFPPLLFQGVLNFREAFNTRMKKREEHREKFISGLATILNRHRKKAVQEPETSELIGSTAIPAEKTSAVIFPLAENKRRAPQPDDAEKKAANYVTLDDEHLELPPELQNVLQKIYDDLGRVPDHYISSAKQRSGSGISASVGNQETNAVEILPGKDVYDEWDFRRKGFRKNWCQLLQKEIAPVKGDYITNILSKYKGQLIKLRRQFDMLRTQERFVKRQSDGSDIDLDALVEFLADRKAGIPPSDDLFIRLKRDQRSIAAIFLVDMSSSTEGWVLNAIKESLVLLCESLSFLGDSYAIYGFSGMRRLRSELFHIKHLDEQYNDTVKGRISAISPMEYTRMGPPIRHLTETLSKAEAKVRLLITLSDGKPEDYDDYKGEYAIEDTRHALIEAKAKGIHPFCITIDRHAHEYMSHMYGEVNYTFIDNVKKLPNRIPEIYRTLTT